MAEKIVPAMRLKVPQHRFPRELASAAISLSGMLNLFLIAGEFLNQRYTSLGRFLLDLVLLFYVLALPLIFLSPIMAFFLVIPLVFLVLSGKEGPVIYD